MAQEDRRQSLAFWSGISARLRRQPWHMWCYLAGLGLVAAAIMLSNAQPCSRAVDLQALLKASNQPYFGCPEFWLNRYQTLISAILATGLGAAGLIAIYVQIRSLRRQTAGLSANSLRTRLIDYEKDLEEITGIRDLGPKLIRMVAAWDYDTHEKLRATQHNLQELLRDCRVAVFQIGYRMKAIVDAPAADTWYKLTGSLHELQILISAQSRVLIDYDIYLRDGIDNDSIKPNLYAHDVSLTVALFEMAAHVRALEHATLLSIAETRRAIREFEDVAVNG